VHQRLWKTSSVKKIDFFDSIDPQATLGREWEMSLGGSVNKRMILREAIVLVQMNVCSTRSTSARIILLALAA
jgi:hypothetical protein